MRWVIFALVIVGCKGSDQTDGGVAVADMAECPSYNTSSGAGAGGACNSPDDYCLYFEAYCHCNIATRTWYCCTDGVPLACPAQPPSGPDCCRAYQHQPCSYACVGGMATVCSCSDDRWHCTTMPCDGG